MFLIGNNLLRGFSRTPKKEGKKEKKKNYRERAGYAFNKQFDKSNGLVKGEWKF